MEEELELNEMMDDAHLDDLERLLNEGVDEDEPISTATRRSPLQVLRAAGNYLYNLFDAHTGIMAFTFAVVIVGTLYGTLTATVAILEHNANVQAVQRAQKMDGESYTIIDTDWNFAGDTRLYLEDERGGCMSVMMHMNNPFTNNTNPLFLYFSNKRYDPSPLPMRVRVHYRPDAWTDEQTHDQYENFTGSFLTFERLDRRH